MDDTIIITRASRCLSIMNIHGAWGALGAAGVRRVWAGAGLQRAAYRGGGISCGPAHSLCLSVCLSLHPPYDKPSAIGEVGPR